MDVTWGWVNLDSNAKDDDKKYQLYYGVVKGMSIVRLHIKHKGSSEDIDKDAELVQLSDEYKLWFALQDKYSEFHPGILSGYNKDGKEVIHAE